VAATIDEAARSTEATAEIGKFAGDQAPQDPLDAAVVELQVRGHAPRADRPRVD
jgi:hypothetical protein